MKVKIVSEQEVLKEATVILLNHFGPAKMARLIAAWQKDDSDYLNIQDQLFEGETVDTLYDKLKDLESRKPWPKRL
jgi:hypothetical protein